MYVVRADYMYFYVLQKQRLLHAPHYLLIVTTDIKSLYFSHFEFRERR